MSGEQLKELKNVISLDDAALITFGIATIYQVMNIKVPKPLGYLSTALTLYSLYSTVKRINQDTKTVPQINAAAVNGWSVLD